MPPSGSPPPCKTEDVQPVPAFDLGAQHRALSKELHDAVDRVLASGSFILGAEGAALEKEIAAYLGVREAVGCASGTDALHLALRAAEIGVGDEVITSAFSFIATAEAVLHTGATPVLADIDPASFTLAPESVEQALSDKTRAILAVHLYGHPADMDALAQLAERHRLILVEDCAQAFGARYRERFAGALSLAGCHSFYPSKNLGACGDAGMITTDDADFAQQLRQLRHHGSADGTGHEIIGYNSRLDEIQAAILRVKLRHIDDFNRKRCTLAALYTRTLQEQLQTPVCAAGCEHVFNQYTIVCEQRDAVAATLAEQGIGSRIYYPTPLSEEAALRGVCRSVDCTQAARVARQCLSLPMFPELTEQDALRVAAATLRALH